MVSDPTWPTLLSALLGGEDLSISEASWAMQQVMAGEATPAQLAGFLVALRSKGETVDEIVGFRDAILEYSLPLSVDPMALDIVGTGGDRFGTVNVSTMASVVAAASGVPLIKHGNRAASSASGSSDVLGALGIDLDIRPERVAEVLTETGITFAYAAMFHPGFGHAGAVRKELGIPTVFNFLGPLCNPARCEANAVGVASLEKVPLIVGVFRTRGATALVFRGDDGLDELTTTGHSHIWEVSRGSVTEHDLDPLELGIPRAKITDLLGGDAVHNAAVARAVLGGERGPVRDIVLLNAAAGLVAFDLAKDPAQLQIPIVTRFREKLAIAASVIDSGAATEKLDQWVAATNA
ncbi:anthranilate phosphoribosyltransferase [Lacisediminihabitans changchengi]|uniref:Anthranilate phosphoribosyltransferase n=1 Tax=Lacisediminihabitans changchengi TaxID=2787634 RepID=A0A934W3D2_9MICO|nr:anthranilate phosphoribosyltransferase [Lacisediminihabitans changchengi]MBK4347086.1 anthranilate phosphoribosyltransferase [Lacisediminihabitans changchengi]MBK4347791.1 anthranilate phosphoribosyltransferase [Lacisediminihabitans changchengi]